jgi:hypothetical protein
MVFNFSKKTKKINNRKLGERSHLVFEFPGPKGNLPRRCYLPMLENCQVTESQKSNLAEYSLLGRNSSIYSYMGAKSRTFSLTFKISLLHILTQESSEGIADMFSKQFTAYGLTKEAKVAAFAFMGVNLDGVEGYTKKIKGKEHAALHRSYYQKIAKIRNPGLSSFDSALNSVFSFIGADSFVSSDPSYDSINKIIDLIIFWVNLVRSSTKNNSTNTIEGPPIVRLNHGTMYNNIPCVVDSYNIRIIDDSGYDVQTMTPKQIEISMNLNETRVGDFSEFKSGEDVKGDNNVGWEAVFTENNMDPYNGLIR